MKITEIILKICRILLGILWRAALTAAVICAVICLGAAMILNMVFNGPSVTARDQLTTTMLEYDLTREIPGLFLEQSVIDSICQISDTLPSEISDTALIEPGTADEQFWQVHPDGIYTEQLEDDTYTAQITLMRDSTYLVFGGATGENYAGFTEDGILIVTTSADSADILDISGRCGKILIMDGQVNTGLYNSNSGYAARSAIGQCADGTVLLVSIDGGTESSLGGTYQDLIDIMQEYGAVNACCLSGSWISEE